MMKRVSLVILSAVTLSALLFLFNTNPLQGQPPKPNTLAGNINRNCCVTGIQIFQLQPPGVCPMVSIRIRNTGNCPIEVVYSCAGQETARFGPQPGQQVRQTFPADRIIINCQDGGARCRGNFTIRW